ncbi:hypothetical protein [Nitrosovibrio sp. Nv6]|uniref:hypothetical protein n=1 Tax=Nitrosovibrio sp. Nv6 TaxID=1855340 RepID=UPI00116003DF|nr:hypothetical protein [Nitrosovibrio sp. Nv6]
MIYACPFDLLELTIAIVEGTWASMFAGTLLLDPALIDKKMDYVSGAFLLLFTLDNIFQG